MSHDEFGLPPLLPANQETPVISDHGDNGTFAIHRNQYNIARLIVQKWFESGCLSAQKLQELKSINLIMIGPPFVALKEQTKADLDKYLDLRGINALPNRMVINSSSLPREWDKFFDRVKSQSGEHQLHLVVHDEAHYGISKDSNINQFLSKLHDTMTEQKERHLAILLVSATSNVITKSVSELESDLNHVDWGSLQNDEHYRAPNYTSIRDLRYMVDSEIGKNTKMGDAAKCVIAEYEKAAENIGKGEENCEQTPAYTVLKRMVDSNDPIMAVIRLCNEKSTDKSTSGLVTVLSTHLKDKGLYFVQLDSDNADIDTQLRKQGYEGDKVSCVRELDKLKVIVVVIEMLRMGERIPNTCMYFDVRSRYLNKGIQSRATFIQDIGRCAGHNKPKDALILVGVDHSNPDKIIKLDALLRGLNKDAPRLSSKHPEYPEESSNGDSDGDSGGDSGVYTRLKEHIVVLDAEPQIGKTGAILSVLDILQRMLFSREYHNNVGPSTLNHIHSKTELQNFKPNEEIVERLILSYENQYHDDEPLVVADCGCGDMGIIAQMRKEEGKWKATTVHGFDTDASIEHLAEFEGYPKFVPHVGDMCGADCLQADGTVVKFNVIIFCLSFFEDNVDRYREWCSRHLDRNGRVIILETKTRVADLAPMEEEWKTEYRCNPCVQQL